MTPTEPETYTLDQAGETLGVSAADIRSYIDEGLVVPREGPGGEALFTRVEMRRLWSIATLHRDLGINLPGVAAVLQLREQFEQVRRDLVTLVEIVERELGPDVWDRLWPEGRPRPDAHISVDGFSDLSPPSAPGDSAPEGEAAGGDREAPGGTST